MQAVNSIAKRPNSLETRKMVASTKTPVIIGVGEIKNPSRRKEDAIEPLDLMLSAINASAHDADGSRMAELLACVDSVSVVASSTWSYTDLPKLLSAKLGIRPSHKAYSALAGSASIQLIDDTARLIAKGDSQVGVAVGGGKQWHPVCMRPHWKFLLLTFFFFLRPPAWLT